ncbi:DinB family protein [Spirosoma endophyticum]|uniref:DinB superfamily protein n=1 Tax=Spirosoma endophyticum TaxID=662367 RepID=A0A1I1WDP7_9BACT|nr:DinB family protein [Spirosoma endophyticum]SFD93296.1 DinB superfamily protein [Spirosoma endophyticum]
MQIIITDLQKQLANDCQAFVDVVHSYTDEAFTYHPDGKWSVGDVVQHLYLSARPVARLMAGPREVFDQWGKPTGSSSTYDELASAYKQILTTGVKASAAMSPQIEDMQEGRSIVMARFAAVYEALLDVLSHWSEQELDNCCMPHPALGKLTVREMIYFTSIHTQHHLRLLPKP